METTVFEVTFKSGEVYRVFCANKSQKKRFKAVLHKIGKDCKWVCLVNGIHTVKEFEEISEHLN